MFLWTNIEISLGVISACLPTYRPIWLFFKGTPVSAKKSYKMSSYWRFGSSSDKDDKPDRDGQIDVDSHRLTDGPSVDTIVETGVLDRRNLVDDNMIAVEHEMYTNSRLRRPD